MLTPGRGWSGSARILLGCALLLLCGLTPGWGAAPRTYDLPAGEASRTLRLFAETSDREILFAAKVVRGVTTNAVRGEFTALEALERMLAGTRLQAVPDEMSGAIAVRPSGDASRQNPNHPNDTPMKSINPKKPLAALIAGVLAIAVGHTTQSQENFATEQSGTIRGRVSNAATSVYLQGARVAVAGTQLSTVTDRTGHYLLSVPAGSVTLEASYTGLDRRTISLSVAPGQVVVEDFALTSDVYLLDAFTVEGEREGNARAVTLQRQAPNVKNIVATDAFGNIANGNVGEFLQRLPGIAGVYVGSEVVGISVRGLPPGQNAVMMDGDRVASSDSANAGRGFVFEQTSLNLIESVEVTKAPTPDMDADSMGGNVNMVTKSAFDRADAQSFAYAVGFSNRWGRRAPANAWYKEPFPGLMPSMNFTYSNVVGPRRNIGIMLTGTWHVQATADIRSDQLYQQTLARPNYVYSVAKLLIGSPRSRFSLGAKVDYKWSDNTVITLNTSYSWMHDSQVTQTHTLSTSQAIATFDANGNRTGTGTIHPSYTDTFTEVLTSNNSLSTLNVTTIDKTGGTTQFKPSVRHTFDGGRLVIDYNASWSKSYTWYDAHPYDRKYKDRPKGTVNVQLRDIGWTVDRSHSLSFPDIVQTAGPDLTNLANYSNMMLTQPNRSGFDEIVGARFNARKQFDFAAPASLKAGFNLRRQERNLENNSRQYMYTGTADVGRFVNTTGRYHELTDAFKQQVRHYLHAPFPDAYAVAEHARDNPGEWSENITHRFTQYFANLRSMTEEVGGAYLMGDVRLGRLTVLGGLRVEETRTEGSGPLQALTPEEVARRAAWVGTVTAAEAERRVRAEYEGRLHNKASYRSVFPGIHFKYEAANGIVARLSHTNGIGRPGFGSIMPNSTVSYTAQTITYSNPALKPQYSENYDVSLEYYFEPVGLVSVGAFSKNVTDFIFQDRSQFVGSGPDNGFDGEYEGFNIITSANGGSARYRGLEFSFQQQFTFLPGILSRLGVNANYTYLSTKGDYGGATVTNQVAGFRPRTANVVLSYRGPKLRVSLQGHWVGTWLTSNSTNVALLRYAPPRTQVDVKTNYSLSRRTSLFLDVENLFNEPLSTQTNYLAREDRKGQTRISSPKLVFGVQGRF